MLINSYAREGRRGGFEKCKGKRGGCEKCKGEREGRLQEIQQGKEGRLQEIPVQGDELKCRPVMGIS